MSSTSRTEERLINRHVDDEDDVDDDDVDEDNVDGDDVDALAAV